MAHSCNLRPEEVEGGAGVRDRPSIASAGQPGHKTLPHEPASGTPSSQCFHHSLEGGETVVVVLSVHRSGRNLCNFESQLLGMILLVEQLNPQGSDLCY